MCHLQERGPCAHCTLMVGEGAQTPFRSQGGPRKPLKSNQTLCTPQRALVCCKHHPQPRCHKSGLTHLPPPWGCSQLPGNPTPGCEVGLVLGAQGRGSGSKETLTPLKLDLQHVRGVGRVGRIAGLRVEPGRSLALQGEGEKRDSQWHCHGQHCWQPQPRSASRIPKRIPLPGAHPPSQSAGPARHSTGAYRGPWEQRGWQNQPIFPLNLISSFPPTPPQLEAGWLRRSKSGREKQDAGS